MPRIRNICSQQYTRHAPCAHLPLRLWTTKTTATPTLPVLATCAVVDTYTPRMPSSFSPRGPCGQTCRPAGSCLLGDGPAGGRPEARPVPLSPPHRASHWQYRPQGCRLLGRSIGRSSRRGPQAPKEVADGVDSPSQRHGRRDELSALRHHWGKQNGVLECLSQNHSLLDIEEN